MNSIGFCEFNEDRNRAEIGAYFRGLNKKCKFMIPKKKRYCKLVALKNQSYCSEHILLHTPVNNDTGEESNGLKRIPCPYDPKHSCLEKLLESHKKRCNSRPQLLSPYYSEGFNSLPKSVNPNASRTLADLSPSELARLASIVCTAYQAQVRKPTMFNGNLDMMDSHIETPGFGHKAKRHLKQVSSLLGMLEIEKLLEDSTCFVELGSGKGMLTFHLAEAVQQKVKSPETCRFILVDRESHRHKRDNKYKDTPNIVLERVRVDLANLMLDRVQAVRDCKTTVGYSKHLCGEATDLALKCLLEHNSVPEKVNGILIATCCHHKCTWHQYVGREYLTSFGIQEEDFVALTGMTSWAVCGTGSSGFEEIDCELDVSKYGWVPFVSEDIPSPVKRILGVCAKRVLDHGRVLYTQGFGFNAELKTYASPEDTLENIAIIATRDVTKIQFVYSKCDEDTTMTDQ